MIYRSNLTAPDIEASFKHLHIRPMGHSFGHSVPSDWADKSIDDATFGFYKNCGMLTHDEAAIIYNIASGRPGTWLDIGAHTGWSTSHLAAPGCQVMAIDPMLRLQGFLDRFQQNTRGRWNHIAGIDWHTSLDFFRSLDPDEKYRGVLIDGDHQPGKPMEDAVNALRHLESDGAIVFHDFVGLPVREAVLYLIEQGFKARVYLTPHGMACCWRGSVEPPAHVAEPGILAQRLPDRWPEWNWSAYL